MAKINGNLIVTAKTTTGSFEVGGLADLYGPIIAHSTLTLNADPTLALQAATKQYVDSIKTYTDTQLSQKLNLSGGTLTGPLILASNPTDNLGAATKQYVDSMSSSGGTTIQNGTEVSSITKTLISTNSTTTNTIIKTLTPIRNIKMTNFADTIVVGQTPYISFTASNPIPFPVRLDASLSTAYATNFLVKNPSGLTGSKKVLFINLDFGYNGEIENIAVGEGIDINIIIDDTSNWISQISLLYNGNSTQLLSYGRAIYDRTPNSGYVHLKLTAIRTATDQGGAISDIPGRFAFLTNVTRILEYTNVYTTPSEWQYGNYFLYRDSAIDTIPQIFNYANATISSADITAEVIVNDSYFSSVVNFTYNLRLSSVIKLPIDKKIKLTNIGNNILTIVPENGVSLYSNSITRDIGPYQTVTICQYQTDAWIMTHHDGYADTKLSATGGTLTGNLFLNGDPASPTQAATKNYVDTGLALKANKAGDTFTGPVILAANPTTSLQAATKNYVDIAPYAKYYDLKATFVNGGIAVVAADANVVYITVPQSGNLSFYSLLGNGGPSGCSVDVWKVPYASFPPSVTNSITGGNYPTISGTSSASDGTLSGWTVSVSTGDIIGIKLRTNGLFTSIFFTLRVTL